MKKYIIINPQDNVMIALENFHHGDVVNNTLIKQDINKGHKVALRSIQKDENIIKYGQPIGRAKELIEEGTHVHTHNVMTNLNDVLEYSYNPKFEEVKIDSDLEIMAYPRKYNQFGIRNEIWVIPTVGCINGHTKFIVDAFLKEHPDLEIDGVFSFTHPFGCSQMGDDLVNTRETLQNIAKHPNAGGVLVLGLGCENNTLKEFVETMGEYDKDRIRFLNFQSVLDEVTESVNVLNELYELMKKDKRVKTSISNIKIGLKCGGSDGLSGITANPLIGSVSDYFIKRGATAVLTEVPEMFGAEHILMEKCINENVFNNLVDLINNFKDYYKSHNQVIYDNPSPGNKDGGITTLEEKSLGCIQKGGVSPIVDVLKTTDLLKKPGLNIIRAPGNDLISTTTLAMSGCQLVLFSTGRGTPFGGFVPTLKIATNNELAQNKKYWIDYNAGNFSQSTIESETNNLANLIIDVINGKKTRNEINQSREIAIMKDGVIL
jgi:altronate hydrolase